MGWGGVGWAGWGGGGLGGLGEEGSEGGWGWGRVRYILRSTGFTHRGVAGTPFLASTSTNWFTASAMDGPPLYPAVGLSGMMFTWHMPFSGRSSLPSSEAIWPWSCRVTRCGNRTRVRAAAVAVVAVRPRRPESNAKDRTGKFARVQGGDNVTRFVIQHIVTVDVVAPPAS